MKTSFYIVLWAIIYTVLHWLNNEFIYNNSFLVALGIDLGLSVLLKGLMPNITAFEQETESLPILEDVFNNNILSFKKRLSRDTNIAVATSLYFIISTVIIVFALFEYRINDWLALILFVFVVYSSVSHNFRFYKSKLQLNKNPVTGVCIEICESIYKLDYREFECDRDHIPYKDMLPSTPRFFKTFKIISIVFAVFAVILGLLFTLVGLSSILGYSLFPSGAVYVGRFIFGSLAIYFGIKDVITTSQYFTAKRNH